MTPPPPPTTPAASPHTEPAGSLAAGYRAIDGAWSEMVGSNGQPRAAWQPLLHKLDTLGPEAIARRWSAAQRVIQDNGVTYNVYGDPRGMHRPWALDPMPLVLDEQDWAALEPALIQRAHLLNLLLADLYGPNTLLRDGTLPADLVFANPNFLRPCVGVEPRGGRHLTLTAFDLARNPDGQWWVVNDRTQAPSGAGYALENRLIISRAFPDLFRDCGVTRLARFYSRLRQELARISPQQNEDPFIVVLTPGPMNETYFEHAYLARYLGFTLVEGGDLTVRDSKVYLKTLGGLQRVDVILRRLDDSYCDPLELRTDSVLGLAGLLQAAAAGNVAIANALGSGLIETQSIMPFLPMLSKQLLGEELKLPSVATWWCGQPKELAYVMEHLPRLVIKPAFMGEPWPPVFGAALSKDETEALKARILARPHRFVAQESVSLSTAPAWRNGTLDPRHVMLRVFVAATEDGYTVMPGGLARASAAQDSMIVTMQHGGGSKDAWVLTQDPVGRFSLLQPEARHVTVSRSGHNLPSRVADSLYWLGRYVERAENLTEMLRAIYSRMTEETSPDGCPELPHLIAALADMVHRQPDDGPITNPLVDHKRTLEYLAAVVFDTEQPGSLRDDIDRTLQLGSIVRDRISLDTWRIVNQIDRTLKPQSHEQAQRSDPTTVLDVLDQLVIPLAAFAGLGNESMTHGHGWRFLDLGRRVERAQVSTTLLHALALEPDDNQTAVLDALLTVSRTRMTYRSRYRIGVSALPVIDLLLQDETNPRSVAFQLARAETHIAALPKDAAEGQRTDDERMVLAMLASLRLADLDELVDVDEAGRRTTLARLLESLDDRLPEFSDLLSRRYLTHVQAGQRLTALADLPAIGDDTTL
ncbi:MAG: circularly permuted type 2 ATP-grasp protein [Planctomycetota bacterium]